MVEPLVASLKRSPAARERTKVILLTMTGDWSVKEGLERLGIGRTRFQVLRRRMLDGACAAVEERPTGRPAEERAGPTVAEARLRAEVASLREELQVTKAQLEVARIGVGRAVERRLLAKAVRR